MIRNKRGMNLLTEQVVFIILNVLFLSILLAFLYFQGAGKIILEKNTAKQIALLIDSSNSGTEIVLDLSNLNEKKESEVAWRDVVSVSGKDVVVRLDEKSEGRYTFFNDVNVRIDPASETSYRIVISEVQDE